MTVSRYQNGSHVNDSQTKPIIEEDQSNISDYDDAMRICATPTMYAAAKDHKNAVEHFMQVQKELTDRAVVAPTKDDKKACGHNRDDNYVKVKNIYTNPITESIAYREYLREDDDLNSSTDVEPSIVDEKTSFGFRKFVSISGKGIDKNKEQVNLNDESAIEVFVDVNAYESYVNAVNGKINSDDFKRYKNIFSSATIANRVEEMIDQKYISPTVDYEDEYSDFYAAHMNDNEDTFNSKWRKYLSNFARNLIGSELVKDNRDTNGNIVKEYIKSLFRKSYIPDANPPRTQKIKGKYYEVKTYNISYTLEGDTHPFRLIVFDKYSLIDNTSTKNSTSNSTINIPEKEKQSTERTYNFKKYLKYVLFGKGDTQADAPLVENKSERQKYFGTPEYYYPKLPEEYIASNEQKNTILVPIPSDSIRNKKVPNNLQTTELLDAISERFNLPMCTEEDEVPDGYKKCYKLSLVTNDGVDLSEILNTSFKNLLLQSHGGDESNFTLYNATKNGKPVKMSNDIESGMYTFAKSAFGYTTINATETGYEIKK